VINATLVRDLKAKGLWDAVMVSDLKYFDGSVGGIDRMPNDLNALYATKRISTFFRLFADCSNSGVPASERA
jgi:hypothetical protein